MWWRPAGGGCKQMEPKPGFRLLLYPAYTCTLYSRSPRLNDGANRGDFPIRDRPSSHNGVPIRGNAAIRHRDTNPDSSRSTLGMARQPQAERRAPLKAAGSSASAAPQSAAVEYTPGPAAARRYQCQIEYRPVRPRRPPIALRITIVFFSYIILDGTRRQPAQAGGSFLRPFL